MTDLPPLLVDGPAVAPVTYAFAHGAGVGMNSEFMDYFAQHLGAQNIRVARFEFPYMQKTRADGKRRPPDRMPVLLATWQAVVDELGRENLFIGGKSMGGRVASMVVAEMEAAGTPVSGGVFVNYPFHPPGKPDKLRIDHLGALKTPSLILQGTRDPFGTISEVPNYPLSKNIEVSWIEDGEHSFIPRKSSGRTKEQNWDEAITAMAAFMASPKRD